LEELIIQDKTNGRPRPGTLPVWKVKNLYSVGIKDTEDLVAGLEQPL
jgi:hypothetical protein